MLYLAKYLKDFKKELIIGPLFKLTEAIFELIVPLVMAKIIDVGIANVDKQYILKMGGLMLLLGAVGLCCALICQYMAARASQGFGTKVRSQLFRHINTLSHAEIDRLGTPSLITRLINDVNQLQVAVAMLIRLVVRAPFLVIGAAVMAAILDRKLALIFFIVIPLLAVTLYFVMAKSVPFYRSIQQKLDKLSLITRENLIGARVIRAFSKQETEQKRFDAANEDLLKASVNVGKISALLNPATSLIMNGSIVAIIWFGALRVNVGSLSQGQIIAFVNYMTQILLALVVVANLVVIFTKAAASGARVQEVFETTSSVSDAFETEATLPFGALGVEWKHVSFSYQGSDEAVLNDISFSAPAGSTIGIIGGTGAGKSTLVNLISRFYDVTEGEILIGGINIKQLSLQQLRSRIGVVPQRAVLFSGTLEENMKWRLENATSEEIAKALEISQSAEFVKNLPDGMNTQILQGGKNLSGGQRQRLTIARALVGDPDVLILDDSASALDFATDAKLRAALKEKCADKTVFLVSQRVNTVRGADCIIVLDEGKIVGSGTHSELMKNCEAYREICLSQLSEKEAAGE